MKDRHKGRKSRRRGSIRKPPGGPADVLHVDPTARPPQVRILAYGPGGARELNALSGVDLGALRREWSVLWVDIDGLGDASVIKAVGEAFGLHALAMEDIVNTQQRPKLDHFEDHDYIVARMIAHRDCLETEQLSLFLGPGFVLTFQDGAPGDPFTPVRERILREGGAFRRGGADYLAYALLDAVIDAYFPVLEAFGERLETLEDEVLSRPGRDAVGRIHAAKRELLTIRRAIWPLREAINALIRDPNPRICDETRLFLRDCYDHAVRIIDLTETCRELGADLMDLYVSSLSQRLNEVMKVLTIISTVFIPLNFIAGVYGMNFAPEASPLNMPELKWYYGYPFALSLMLLIGVGLLVLFVRWGWLGRAAARRG